MNSRSVNGLTLYFGPGEGEAAEIIGGACRRSVWLIHEMWDIPTPADCRIYVMTDWLGFVFYSAPWHWRILLGISLPIWYLRVRRLWPYAGGWAVGYPRRRVVGVKPPRLVQSSNRHIGEQIFNPQADAAEKVRRITCHELVHAFTAHLKLPAWLHEGLAMVTVDRLAGEPTVKEETLRLMDGRSAGIRPKEYGRLGVGDQPALVYHYVRGYWITRYLSETRLELLREALEQRQPHSELESIIAAGLGMRRDAFWEEIDGVVASFYRPQTR